MKIVMVRWVDSAFMHGWVHRDEAKHHKLSDCISVGLLIHEDKNQLTIVQSSSFDKEQVGDGLTIPQRCIKQIWKLGVRK